MSFVSRIYDFNHNADLVSKGYDDFLEASFQIEEALEGFDLDQLVRTYDLDATSEAKCISRALVETCVTELSDVDRVDKACDAIVFAIGSMTKLGLDPNQIKRAMNIVMDANEAKLGCPKDKFGKLTKPANFPNPEPRLQKLLDERI